MSLDLRLSLRSFCTVIPTYSSTNPTSSPSFLSNTNYKTSVFTTFHSSPIVHCCEWVNEWVMRCLPWIPLAIFPINDKDFSMKWALRLKKYLSIAQIVRCNVTRCPNSHRHNKHSICSKDKETTGERVSGVSREYYMNPPYHWQV
jgi:hypothetical protein